MWMVIGIVWRKCCKYPISSHNLVPYQLHASPSNHFVVGDLASSLVFSRHAFVATVLIVKSSTCTLVSYPDRFLASVTIKWPADGWGLGRTRLLPHHDRGKVLFIFVARECSSRLTHSAANNIQGNRSTNRSCDV